MRQDDLSAAGGTRSGGDSTRNYALYPGYIAGKVRNRQVYLPIYRL
jgi:hypothetical protein